MTCQQANERLPWLLNGTLGGDEAGDLREHLAGCHACRGELAAAHRTGLAFGAHPESGDLVDYALGLPLGGRARGDLEAHLADCLSCRQELAWVAEAEGPAAGTVVSMRAPARWQGWRPLALAASLAAVATSAAFVLQVVRKAPAELNVAVVELLPESQRTRGAGNPALPAPSRVSPGASRSTVLILLTDLAEPFEDYRVRLVGGDGAVRWQKSGLEPTGGGHFTLLLPPGSVPDGGLSLELEGLRDGVWTPLETYRPGR